MDISAQESTTRTRTVRIDMLQMAATSWCMVAALRQLFFGTCIVATVTGYGAYRASVGMWIPAMRAT
ncbi:hypothetical protein GCM10009552_15340 [Rothia nasimurium]